MDQSVRYEDDNSLRPAVEKVARVASTDDEWSALVNDRHAPYDESDFTEMVNAVRGFSVGRPKPSLDSRARDYRRYQGERSALEAKGMTEDFREKLFGQKAPPYQHVIEAKEWIESHQARRETKRLSIEATVPANLGEEESLIWLGNYLAEQVGAQGLRRLLGNFDVLQDISWSMPILEYYILNPDEEIETRYLPAPDGTPLGELRSKGNQLAQSLG